MCSPGLFDDCDLGQLCEIGSGVRADSETLRKHGVCVYITLDNLDCDHQRAAVDEAARIEPALKVGNGADLD